jgi:hypothetical protein
MKSNQSRDHVPTPLLARQVDGGSKRNTKLHVFLKSEVDFCMRHLRTPIDQIDMALFAHKEFLSAFDPSSVHLVRINLVLEGRRLEVYATRDGTTDHELVVANVGSNGFGKIFIGKIQWFFGGLFRVLATAAQEHRRVQTSESWRKDVSSIDEDVYSVLAVYVSAQVVFCFGSIVSERNE